MVSTSEGVVYYCTVLLTALVFLTEASAITTNYEKSTAQNKTDESPSHDVSPQRTKLTPTRGRQGSLSKNQNHDRVSPLVLHKLKSPAAKIESSAARDKPAGELLLPSNSGGENDIKDKGGGNADDEDQKTLSQQVADGKYGLIQDEIFTAKPQRPGVLSYDVNPEVPKDNINNLGGLEPDDIWLAENHLLVLAGGALNHMQNQWTPIDNYVAPKRPVRLPPNPKVPPPFPVQLSENGPIEYLKSDSPTQPLGFHNPLLNQYHFNKSQGYAPSLYGKLPFGPTGGQPPIKPLRPSLPINSNEAPPSPILVKPPPGSEFIPPYLGAVNQSEAFDEDDPSLYYPPPYDFYYPKDNTSKVPPGPLVPGIVLPPPPNFFTLLTNQTKSSGPKQIPAKEKPFKSYTYKAGKQLQYDENPASPPTTINPLEPTTFVTYDNIINDVTYPDTHDYTVTYSDVKANKVSTEELGDGWIPIPAPKPFYITGPKKPIKNTLLVMMETPIPPGYMYDQPANAFKTPQKTPSFKFLHYVDKPTNDFPPTTPLTSQFISTPSPAPDAGVFSSTTPSTPYQSPPPPAIKATYYFYEEPQFVDDDHSKPPPPSSSYSTSSPPVSTKPVGEYAAKPPTNSKPTSEKKRKPITPMIPIYYLAELQNIVDLVKPIGLPYPQQTPAPKTQYYTTTAKPTYTINKPNYERPTSKPILEYSFVASDYNSPSTPASSTPPPPHYNPVQYPVDYNAYYPQAPQYQAVPHYPIYNSAPQYSKPVHTTATPILYLSHVNQYGAPAKTSQYDFERPWLQQLNPFNQYNPISYQTENPYYAFFTKEEEDLIDDNTKKYFTIFGQKIKHSVDATTPLSAQTVTPSPVTNGGGGGRWRGQYAYPNYPSQSSTDGYDSYSSTPAPTYQKPTSYEPASSSSKPLSLEGDTRVNYVTPPPAIDPDAEYVPHKLSKHIRPIVVEDLPADVNERLKNIMNLQHLQDHKHKVSSGTRTNNKYRYTLIDGPFNGGRYPVHNLIDSYGSGNRFADAYSGQGTSTPVSLEGDIRVNYQQPHKLTTNPDAEYVENASSSEYNQSGKEEDEDDHERHRGQESHTSKPHSLANDILVNYKGRYNTNPDAEYIDSGGGGGGSHRGNPGHGGGSSSSNNVISYKYPGVEHGHFYFLTPQETHLSQIEDERYDFQSDVEKPSSYFKRVPRQRDQSGTPQTMAKAA